MSEDQPVKREPDAEPGVLRCPVCHSDLYVTMGKLGPVWICDCVKPVPESRPVKRKKRTGCPWRW